MKELILKMLLDLSYGVAASEDDEDLENYLGKYDTVLAELNLGMDSLAITSLNEEFFHDLHDRIRDLIGHYRYASFSDTDPNLIMSY